MAGHHERRRISSLFNYSKGIYNAAKWLNELYRESLVDKEWFTQKPETAEEKWPTALMP